MTAQMCLRESQSARQVFAHALRVTALLRLLGVIKRNYLFQQSKIAAFLQISSHRQDQPQMVVAVVMRPVLPSPSESPALAMPLNGLNWCIQAPEGSW